MFKKFAAAMLILAPTYCLAWWPGFYIGAGAGADAQQFDEKAHVTRFMTFDVINKTQLAGQGVFGTLFGGYAWMNNFFYVAGELNGNLSSAEFEASNNERLHGTRSKTKYEIDSNWGISILPGILYSDTTLFFARVGYASGNFRIRTTDISLKNADTWLDGIRFGLGIEKNIYPQLDVRMEYNHFIYEDHTQTTFDPVGEVTKRTQVSPTTNQVEFAVVYRFC